MYQKNLMRLAANATGSGKLDHPDREETLDNPTCGDRITIQVRLENGKIVEFAQENRACLLCQASASLLAEQAIGMDAESLDQAIEKVQHILNGTTETENPPWEKLEFFTPVKDHKSRHICVLLPFRALKKLLSDKDN
nr:iron-sulfur cluster assembly scaffold protein [Sneathiella limimaris]